jgi:hypothetical protein
LNSFFGTKLVMRNIEFEFSHVAFIIFVRIIQQTCLRYHIMNQVSLELYSYVRC